MKKSVALKMFAHSQRLTTEAVLSTTFVMEPSKVKVSWNLKTLIQADHLHLVLKDFII